MAMKLAGYQTKSSQIDNLTALIDSNEAFAETYANAAAALLSLRAEDEGWLPITRIEKDDGFGLEALKEIAAHAELQATGNPLLKRGFTLRRDNVFGRGIVFQPAEKLGANGKRPTIPARAQAILDKPINKAALTNKDAFDRNERAAYTTGNLLEAYNRSTETFFPIPFDEVSNFASNPDVKQDVWYYQRSYTKIDPKTNQPEEKPTIVWYPVLEHWEQVRASKVTGAMPTSINGEKIEWDVVVIDFKVNTVIGRVWGTPDCLPAMPYAWAHSEYIRDASKLLKALSTIAWKVVAKSKGNAVNASAKMALPKGQASTATMTAGTDLVAMPRAGQVDMNDGKTIAAYVASALEVSLVALLSDPSAASGSFGAAATLDGPTAAAARARQQLWIDWYKRIYRAIGVSDVVVNFPKIQEDPSYRIAQTLQIGMAYGALHQDEFRASFLEAADVVPLHDDLPEPSPFTIAAQYSVEAQQLNDEKAQAAQDAAAKAAANVQGQGVSKGAGTGLGGDNTSRDAANKPGTGA